MEAVRRVECMEKRRETNAATLEFRWRRMVLRMLVVVLRIQTQVVLEAFDELAAKGKPKAKSGKAGTSKEKRHGMCESQGGNAAPLRGLGTQLPRSPGLHHSEPPNCTHPLGWLKARGNQALKWWCCIACGSRWQRVADTLAWNLPRGVPVGTPPNCPRCRLPMLPRQNRTDRGCFWGCRAFPDCRGTLPLKVDQRKQDVPEPPLSEFMIGSVNSGESDADLEIVPCP